MVDATFVLNLVETVGILIGVTIAIMEIRRSREERNDQVTDQFLSYRYSKEFVESWVSWLRNNDFSTYEEWSEKYSPYVNPETYTQYLSLLTYYNTIGYRLIDGTMKLEKMPLSLADVLVISLYEGSIPIIEEWRRRFNRQDAVKGLEHLYYAVKSKRSGMIYEPNPYRDRLMQR